MSGPLRIGWFSTGRGPGSRALLTAAVAAMRRGAPRAAIACVFCNRERGQDPNSDAFLDLAESYDLPVVTLSDRAFRKRAGGEVARAGSRLPGWRAAYDQAMLTEIAPYRPDICMLAGYMLILAPQTTRAYPFLNLHPAAPGGPIGVWQEVIWQLIAAGARESGALVNVVTPELDKGPVAAFCRYPIRGPRFDPLWAEAAGRTVEEIRRAEGEEHPLFQEIRRQGVMREQPLVLRTLAAVADGRVRVSPDGLTDPSGMPVPGLDLSAEVEADLRLLPA